MRNLTIITKVFFFRTNTNNISDGYEHIYFCTAQGIKVETTKKQTLHLFLFQSIIQT